MEKTRAEKARFQFEFMAMMLVSGRNDEAATAYEKGLAYLTEIIEQEGKADA